MTGDVFCLGMACVDLAFKVPKHPEPSDKIVASEMVIGGGGPAANAALCIARLGGNPWLSAALGNDLLGDLHHRQLTAAGVNTRYLQRTPQATSVATAICKPDGSRSVVNYGQGKLHLEAFSEPLDAISPAVLLTDGHQPKLADLALGEFADRSVTTVLDAGSVHPGTLALHDKVDYLVASARFAHDLTGIGDPGQAVRELAKTCRNVVITLGEAGVVWVTEAGPGRMESHRIETVDENGAGDAFHGAFSLAIARGLPWVETLRYASAAGALACTRFGAAASMPTAVEVDVLRSEQNLAWQPL